MSYMKKIKKLIPGMLLGVCCSAYAANDLVPQLYQQGIQHYTEKKYNAAADYLGQVVDMDASNTEARYYLVYSLSLSGKNELALKHAQILANQNPTEAKYKTLVNQLNAEIGRQIEIKQKNNAAAAGSGHINKEVILGGYKSLDKNAPDSSGMISPREDYTPRDITPPRPLTELEKAIRKIDEEKYDEAEKMLKAIQKNEPKNPEVFYNFGLIQFGRFEYEKAAIQFKKATELDPKHYASFSNMADCYKNLGDYEKAEKAYKKANEIHFDEFTQINLADIELKQGKIAEAEKIYEQIRAKQPGSSEAAAGLAVIRLDQGRLNEAMDLANIALKAGNTGESNYVKGMVLIENKMYIEALEEIAKALAASPGNLKYVLAKALAEVRNMDFSKGLDDANAILEADVENAEARLIIAEAFISTGSESEAEAQLDIVDQKGTFGESYKLRGHIAKRANDLVKAKDCYSKFYDECGYKPNCAYEYAELLETVGDEKTAIEICESIIKNYPNTSSAENAKGFIQRVSGTEEAPALADDFSSDNSTSNQSNKKFRPGKEKF